MVLCGHTGPDARAMLGLGSLNDQTLILGHHVCPLDSRVSRSSSTEAGSPSPSPSAAKHSFSSLGWEFLACPDGGPGASLRGQRDGFWNLSAGLEGVEAKRRRRMHGEAHSEPASGPASEGRTQGADTERCSGRTTSDFAPSAPILQHDGRQGRAVM
eukprot:2401609-Rhodomonas_salina.1